MDSTTAATSPASTIARSASCSSGASGVVTCARDSARSGPIFCSAVLTRPVRIPAASRTATAMPAVVVLPSVPVTPTTPSRRPGSPYHQAATTASASWLRSTTIWTASGGVRHRPLDDDGRRALGDRLAHEGVAVGVRARHGHEEPRRGRPAGSRRRCRAPAAPRGTGGRGPDDAPGRRQPRDDLAERASPGRLGRRERRAERRSRPRPLTSPLPCGAGRRRGCPDRTGRLLRPAGHGMAGPPQDPLVRPGRARSSDRPATA